MFDCFSETTTPDPRDSFAEQPRSINSSFKNKNLNENVGKENKNKDKNINENLDKESNQNLKEEVDGEKETLPFTVVRVSSTVSHARPKIELQNEFEEETTDASATTIEPVPDPAATTTRKGSRPPFLKPLTKFPEIKIPGLDATTSTTSPSTKIRLSIFSRKPGLFHPTTPVSTTITDDSTTAGASTTTTAATATTSTNESTTTKELTTSTSAKDLTTLASVPDLTTSQENATTTEGTTAESTSRGISTTLTIGLTTLEQAEATTVQSTEETRSAGVSSKDSEAKTEASVEESSTENNVESSTSEASTESSTDVDQGTTQSSTGDDESETEFLAETTPDGFTPPDIGDGVSTEGPSSGGGRAGSRFKDLGSLRELFAKRRNQTISPLQAELNRLRSTEVPFTTPPSSEASTRKRPTFLNRFRSTESSLASSTTSPENGENLEDKISISDLLSASSTTVNPLNRSRRPFINRFRTTESSVSVSTSEPESELDSEPEEDVTSDSASSEPSTTGRTRPSFLNRLKTTETPFSTPPLPVEVENRPTVKPFVPRSRSTSTTPEPTQRPLSFFRY